MRHPGREEVTPLEPDGPSYPFARTTSVAYSNTVSPSHPTATDNEARPVFVARALGLPLDAAPSNALEQTEYSVNWPQSNGIIQLGPPVGCPTSHLRRRAGISQAIRVGPGVPSVVLNLELYAVAEKLVQIIDLGLSPRAMISSE